MTPSDISGKPVILPETDPRVELQMATGSRIPWNDYDELDPDDGDSRIVAEALNVRMHSVRTLPGRPRICRAVVSYSMFSGLL